MAHVDYLSRNPELSKVRLIFSNDEGPKTLKKWQQMDKVGQGIKDDTLDPCELKQYCIMADLVY